MKYEGNCRELVDHLDRLPRPWKKPESLFPVPGGNPLWEYARDMPALHFAGRVPIPQPRGERDAQQPVRAELVRVSYPAGIEPSSDADAFRRRGVLVASAEGNPLSPGSAVTMIDASVRRALRRSPRPRWCRQW